MTESILEKLKTNPPDDLTKIVRQSEGSSTFEILNWNVERLSDKGIRNPDGLLLFSGQGQDQSGTRPWSVVLKIIQNEDKDQLPADHFWYWKREVLAFESGLLASLPGPLGIPTCYSIVHHEEDVWIWMEYIADSAPQKWAVHEFVLAAHELGHFNSAYLTGTPLPDFPWLLREHARGWSGSHKLETAWESRFVRQAFPDALRQSILLLGEEREQFYDWLNRLPQTFSHFDFHRRNLMIRQKPDEKEQIVAVDWALCGNSAVGGDLGMLIGMSANLSELGPQALPDMEKPIFEAYMAGLREGGWQGNTELVRLGYTASIAMYGGVTAPMLTAFWTSDKMLPPNAEAEGIPQAMAARWAAIGEFSLTRADEARQLAKRLL